MITYIPNPKDRTKKKTEYLLEFENEAMRMFQAILGVSEYLYRLRELELMHDGKIPIMVQERANWPKKIGRNELCPCGSGKKYKKCCISKYEKAARILQDIYNQKNVDYTIPGARVVEDSILEYEGPQEKLKNKHDKDIIEKIIELSEKEEIRKKP